MRSVEEIAAEAESFDGVAPVDEATWRTLRHRPELVQSFSGDGGFALLVGSELSLVVRPDARGRGVGRGLLEQALAESGEETLLAWSHADHPAAAVLAMASDFKAVRALWVMRRQTSAPLPDLVVPPTVSLRSYRREDADEVVRVNAAAFASHPEQGGMDADDFAARMSENWFDPDGLIVADNGDGSLNGFHWTKRHSPQIAEVYVVAIDPAAHRQGLGKVLTVAGLHHLADAEEVILYVESDNAPAIAVYSGLGFTHVDRDTHVQYRRG